MRKNNTKAKLKSGGSVIGGLCPIESPAVVEVMGYLGYDFLIVDTEHSPMDLQTAEAMVRAADVTGMTPLARVAVNQQQNILRYLDMGCMGVQMPMINTGADAEAVGKSCLYPPRGRRGLAGVRANQWGATGPLGDYTRSMNDEVLVIVQVETMQAVTNLSEILAVPEIDLVFIGPTDLSSAMGHPGETTHPEVLAMIEKLGRGIRDGGKLAGVLANTPEAVKMFSGWGYTYFAANTMAVFSAGARNHLAQARAVLG